MLNKNLFYFLIPVIFAVCLSISPSNYRYGAYPINTCSDNASYNGYCIDCATEMECYNGEDLTLNNCTQTEACQVSKTYATCGDISNVPDCSCPETGNLKKADPYDDSKYLLCNDGERYVFDCPTGEYFNPDTQECYLPPTTTTTTSAPNDCPDEGGVVISLNCTCYRYCLGGNSFYDECCDPGEIYDEDTGNCDFYYPFTCEGKDDKGYVDLHNCSVYHICIDGDIFDTRNCNSGEEYDEGTQLCTSNTTTCNAVVDCGICPDADTYIKIDCLNYYDCIVNEDAEDGELEFVPELRYCQEGTCFDASTTYCDIVL